MIALLQRALTQGRTFRVLRASWDKRGAMDGVRLTWRGSCGAGKWRLFLWTSSLPVPAENSAASANTTDIIDPSVVILARERRDAIITSGPNDLRRLDPPVKA